MLAKPELIHKLYEIGALKFGTFVLKSGIPSRYYVDLRILPSHPDVLMEVGETMGEMILNSPEKPDRLCGIPSAGSPIATAISFYTKIPVCTTRKEPIVYKDLANLLRKCIDKGEYQHKEIPGVEKAISTIEELSGLKTHGIARYVDGDMRDGDNIGLVDDLITDAESKKEARDLVKLDAKRRKIDVSISGVYVFLDREQGGEEALQREKIQLHSATTIREAVKSLIEFGLTEKEYNMIIEDTVAYRKANNLEI